MNNKSHHYILSIQHTKDYFYYITTPIRLTSIYWYVSSLRILDVPIEDKDEIIKLVLECRNEDSFFGFNIKYPSSLLATLNALQIFYSIGYKYYDEQILIGLKKFMNEDGSFFNDVCGEVDNRFLVSAVLILHFLYIMKEESNLPKCDEKEVINKKFDINENIILKNKADRNPISKCKVNNETEQLDNFKRNERDVSESLSYINENNSDKNLEYVKFFSEKLGFTRSKLISKNSHHKNAHIIKLGKCMPNNFIEKYLDRNKILRYIFKCENEDGGFCPYPSAESHAANTFCCISALCSLNSLDLLDEDEILRFLCFRQTESGGFNGRVNKKEDLCYSFWVFSSLYILNRADCIDRERLNLFIEKCCDSETAMYADREGNEPDLYHTLYAYIALSLLDDERFLLVDPGFGI